MVAPRRVRQFDVRSFLESGGVEKESIEFPPNAVIYQQGDPAEAVMYLQKGRVKLSVVAHERRPSRVSHDLGSRHTYSTRGQKSVASGT